MKIDSHQHFWKFDPNRDSWITDEMKTIQRDFLPHELSILLEKHGFDGSVAVQASQSEEETDFLISLAAQYSFIKGVVGWIDLRAKDISERLSHYKAFPVLKGFRHVLQGETQRDLMLEPDFKRGIAALQQHDYTYDILIFPDQLKFSAALVEEFPAQRFVIDHIAKPYISKSEINEWKKDVEHIAKYQNCYCKISGMVTEANWHHWKKEDFRPYLDVVVNAFGPNRILFGSDWPVCLVAANYENMLEIVSEYFSTFSTHEQQLFWGLNAMNFYKLS
jgi:L-fuconolactonase